MSTRILALAAVLILVSVPIVASEGQGAAREPHPPIRIVTNDGWESCGCTSQGNGSEENPYVIEELRIVTDQPGAVTSEDGAGIAVLKSDVHAIIRNVTIMDGGDDEQKADDSQRAMDLRDVANVTIENIDIDHGLGEFDAGIVVQTSRDLTVRSLDLRDPAVGVFLDGDNVPLATMDDTRNIEVRDVAAASLKVASYVNATIEDVEIGSLRAELLEASIVRNASVDGRALVSAAAGETLTVENITADQLLSRIIGFRHDPTPGTVILDDAAIGSGGLRANDVHLTMANTTVQGQLEIRAAPPDDLTDIVLVDNQITGDLTVENPRTMHTDNNTIQGGYSVINEGPGIEAWTVGEPDIAGGEQVHVLGPGETLSDTTVPYMTVIGDPSAEPAQIENVTVEPGGTGYGLFLQGPVEARALSSAGKTSHAMLINRGNVELSDTQLQAHQRGIETLNSELTLRNVELESGYALLQPTDSTITVEDSDLRTTRAFGIQIWGISQLTLENTSLVADSTAIMAFGRTSGDLNIVNSSVTARGPAIRDGAGLTIEARDCYLESDSYFTIAVGPDTSIERCTLQHNNEIWHSQAILSRGPITVHDSNIISDAEHYDQAAASLPTGEMGSNWWGPNDLPITRNNRDIEPLRYQPVNEAPTVAVQRVDAGWRLALNDDQGRIEDAGWTLEDGTMIEADGEWPLWNTTLSEDRLEPGGHHVTAHAVDIFDERAEQHAPLLVPDPTGDPTVVIDGPLETAPGEETTYTARTAGSVATLEWDLGDDGTVDGTADTFTWTPDRPGERELAVTASDGAGTANTDRVTIEVVNPPPTAAIEGPSSATVGETVTLDSISSDDGAIIEQTWDVHANGTRDATGSSFNYTPKTQGLHVVELLVVDEHGAQSTATRVLDVGAQAAGIPELTVTPTPPTAGEAARLSVTNVSDPAFDVHADGTIDAASRSLDWRFETAGTYAVRVLDEGEPMVEASVDVLAPDELAFTSSEAIAGVTLDLAGHGDGWDAYAWDIHADGTVDHHGDTATTIPDAAGPLNVTLHATSGTETASVTRTLQVAEPSRAVDLAAEPSRGVAPLNGTLHIALDSPDVPTSWSLDVDGDGSVDEAGDGAPPRTLPLPGTQPGSLTAEVTLAYPTQTLTATAAYTVLAPDETAPDVELGLLSSAPAVAGEPLEALLHATSPTNLSSYQICLADTCQSGSLRGEEDRARVQLDATAGLHTLTARVEDVSGNVGEAEHALEVTANTPPRLSVSLAEPPVAFEPVNLTTRTVDPENRSVSLAWQVPELGLTGQGSPNLTLPGGTYTLHVTATDPSGASASATTTLTVLEQLDLGLDLTPSEHTTHGIHGIDVFLQPAWSQAPAQVEGILAVDWRPASDTPWTGLSSREFEGSTQTIHLEGPFPPGQVRVSATVVATQPPSAPIADDGHTATASQILEVGPG